MIGKQRQTAGTCDGPIGRHSVNRTRMAIMALGKEAKTDWSVEHSFGGQAALVSCVIHTGRTHQIRVHMSSMNHPLLGDTAYGYRPSRLKGIDVPRVMLHSTELHVQHPEGDEEMEFVAPLPADFKAMIDRLTSWCGCFCCARGVPSWCGSRCLWTSVFLGERLCSCRRGG